MPEAMLRRTFLASLAAIFLPSTTPRPVPELTRAEWQALIARSLQTPNGKLLLAQAMYRPARCRGRDYPWAENRVRATF